MKALPFALLCLLGVIGLLPARAATTQAAAQAEADALYRKASDRSLESSVVNAMRTMAQLGKGNLVGAYKTGTAAYGQYDNAGKLDYARNQAREKEFRLGDGKGPPPVPVKTTFSRLSTAFLRSGEGAAAAAEFEKATGMKRDTMFRRMSEASDNPIEWNDPQLAKKFVARLDGLASDMTDSTFKTVFRGALKRLPLSWVDPAAPAVKAAALAASTLPGKAGAASEPEIETKTTLGSPRGQQTTTVAEAKNNESAGAVVPVSDVGVTPGKLPVYASEKGSSGRNAVGIGFMKDILRTEREQSGELSLFARVKAQLRKFQASNAAL